MESIRWSDDYREGQEFTRKVNLWYHQALELIKAGQYTIMGQPINPNNPKEVVAVLYLISKDYELFHEKF